MFHFLKIDNFQQNRVLGLDILRSIAILLVVYSHAIIFIPPRYLDIYKVPLLFIDGVSIFFVLSGFLIGGILLKIISKRFQFKDVLNFWIRRWFRTIPNYFFILFLVILYCYFSSRSFHGLDFRYFIFSQNILSKHPNFFPEAWSLTVEEWFYLLFPVMILFFISILKNKKMGVILAALILLILPILIRIIKSKYFPDQTDVDSNYRKVLLLRLDSLMYGVIAAYVNRTFPKFWSKNRYYFLLLSIVFLFALFYMNRFNTDSDYLKVYQFNMESLVCLFALPFFSSLTTTRINLFDNLFCYISIISYSMYLINYSLILNMVLPDLFDLEIMNIFNKRFYIPYIFYWVIVLFLSTLIYKYFERPITDLRDKIKI